MAKEGGSPGTIATLAAGVIIGAVEVVLAVAFAAFVFGGTLIRNLGDGIGLYLAAAALTLGFLAWRAGDRGVVGSVQDAATAVIAGNMASSNGSANVVPRPRRKVRRGSAIFVTIIGLSSSEMVCSSRC